MFNLLIISSDVKKYLIFNGYSSYRNDFFIVAKYSLKLIN